MKNWFRYAVVLLIVVLAGALGAQWLAHRGTDFGQVLVRAGGNEYGATLPGALLTLLIAGLAAWVLWSLLALPFRVWGRHRRKQARARLIEGLEALHGGHWQRAETLLERAADDDEVGAIARAGAVRAAAERDDDAGMRRHLSALQARSPSAHAIAAAELAHARHDAASTLEALSAAAAQPLPPRGLVLQARALAAQHRAGEAYGLLGAIRQRQALSPVAFAALEAQLAAQSVAQAADANQLAERWEGLGKALRAEPAIVAAYAERAAGLRWEDAATRALEQALDARWDESLAALYGRLPVGKLDSRRASAQRWLSTHPNSPALLLTLAQLARRQGQWPQAQDFLHRALAQGAGADAWEELGHGYAAAGDELLARRSYANALNAARGQATDALPGRDLRQKIGDEAVVEERDEHGVPRLRG